MLKQIFLYFSGHAQIPSFLQALYGATTTKPPIKAPIKVPPRGPLGGQRPPPPPPPPFHRQPPGPPPPIPAQPRIERQNSVDDIYSVVTPNSINTNQIITASSPSPNNFVLDNNLDSYNNIPLSNPLLSQPSQQNINVQPTFGISNNPATGPGGSFASSPSVRIIF